MQPVYRAVCALDKQASPPIPENRLPAVPGALAFWYTTIMVVSNLPNPIHEGQR